MIQDIFPKKLKNEYRERRPSAGDRVVVFQDQRILLKDSEEIEFLTYEQLSSKYKFECTYLFSIGEEYYFFADREEKREFPGFSYYKMSDVRSMKPKEHVFAAVTAYHLYCWYQDNQFCGRCGKRLIHNKKLRMMECTECGNEVFPKIAPAVIVGVTSGNKILMTKYAGREYKRYALVAGFIEIGETAEETVAREVMEEVGLRVKNVTYYKSQPWGFDSNLLLGYFCEADSGQEIKLDKEELTVAEWVDYREIPDDTEGLSLTREMMTAFRDFKRGLNLERCRMNF